MAEGSSAPALVFIDVLLIRSVVFATDSIALATDYLEAAKVTLFNAPCGAGFVRTMCQRCMYGTGWHPTA